MVPLVFMTLGYVVAEVIQYLLHKKFSMHALWVAHKVSYLPLLRSPVSRVSPVGAHCCSGWKSGYVRGENSFCNKHYIPSWNWVAYLYFFIKYLKYHLASGWCIIVWVGNFMSLRSPAASHRRTVSQRERPVRQDFKFISDTIPCVSPKVRA